MRMLFLLESIGWEREENEKWMRKTSSGEKPGWFFYCCFADDDTVNVTS